jgi:hypothetical protein
MDSACSSERFDFFRAIDFPCTKTPTHTGCLHCLQIKPAAAMLSPFRAPLIMPGLDMIRNEAQKAAKPGER